MKVKAIGEILECPICGTKVCIKRKWQKYCSDKCRFEAWLRKEMQKRIDAGTLQ